MKKCLVIMLLVFYWTVPLLAQVSVTWSDFQDDAKSAHPRKVLSNDKYIYFFIHPQRGGDHRYIEIFDKSTLKLIKKIELYPEFDVLPRGFSGVSLFKDHLISFRSFYDRKAGRNIFYAKKISLDGDVDKKELEIGNIEAPMGKSDPGSFSYALSPDEDELIITENIKLAEDSTVSYITSYNSDFKKSWRKEISLNKNRQRFKVKDCGISKTLVSSNGDVYLLGWFKKSGTKNELKNQPENFYNVYLCHSGPDAPKQLPLDHDDKYLNIVFGINDSDKLVVTGTYSEKESKTHSDGRNKKDFSIEGVFYILIDTKNARIVASTMHPFTPEFLSLFENSDLTENNKGIYCFDLNHHTVAEDGSVVISGQQYYYSAASQSGGSAPGVGAADAYNSANASANDIYAVKINNDGAVAWERLIKTSQHGSSGSIPMIGYGVFSFKDDLYFIFNDHPDNVNGKVPIREVKSLEESTARMVKLDSNGNATRSVLFDNKQNVASYYPGVFYHKAGSETAIIFSSTEHRYKLGKIQFK
ncbi:MAG: hypothetical protein K0Q95_1940 [Bacteroidota bacterium]|jgi:hypothetical protein|nr:hypothetical protein [Bacteroidota bacterium]